MLELSYSLTKQSSSEGGRQRKEHFEQFRSESGESGDDKVVCASEDCQKYPRWVREHPLEK